MFTDIHYGLKNDSILRLDIADSFINDNLIPYIKEHNIKYVIFGGDLFHSRNYISVNTMNRVIDMISKLAKLTKLYIILGNHDIHLKNTKEIHSIKMLSNIKNVITVVEPLELIVNDKRMLLCPWLSDLSNYEEESFDYLIGHFDISSKYLIASYIEDQKIKSVESSDELTSMLLKNGAISIQQLQDTKKKDISSFVNRKTSPRSSKYIGRFIDICKKDGVIMSGHIHTHKEFQTRGRKFVFVGSPFQQNWGERNNSNGFYDIDMLEDNKQTFIQCNEPPKHIEVKLSDLLHIEGDIDCHLFNNNFVKLLVDTKLEYDQLNKIINTINASDVLEPCIIEYQIFIGFDNMVLDTDVSFDDTSFDKSHYIISCIDNIDDDVLVEHNLDKHKLKQISLQYFKQAEENLRVV